MILDVAKRNGEVRLALGDLAEVYRCERVARLLKERFGKGWQSTYGKDRRVHPNVIPPP